MSARDPLVVWRDQSEWTDARDVISVKTLGAGRLSTGYYLMLPVQSEKEGYELAKRITHASEGKP